MFSDVKVIERVLGPTWNQDERGMTFKPQGCLAKKLS